VWITPPSRNNDAYSQSDLNLLMNSFDVNANVGGGEGWGLSHMESGICGVPQLVPDWSATREIWTQGAEVIPISEVIHAAGGLNTAQAVVNTDAVGDALLRLYEDEKHRERLGEEAYELTSDDKYNWDTVAEQFRKVITRAAMQKGVEQRGLEVNVGTPE
jgi:glycosyltransferase involved in cell wall biosynthesis